jgi:hypothetical protein
MSLRIEILEQLGDPRLVGARHGGKGGAPFRRQADVAGAPVARVGAPRDQAVGDQPLHQRS